MNEERGKASAIVPAYNEAERVGSVLDVLLNAEGVGEVLVIDDGSTDSTAAVVEGIGGVQLIQSEENQGKANALALGAERAVFPTLLFLDADLIDLKPSHVEDMLDAYWEGSVDMVIGVFHKGRLNTDLSQKINPHLSGQRVMSQGIWSKVKEIRDVDFGIEMAMTKVILKENLKVGKVKLDGVTHVMKEEKRGLGEGLKSRLHMYKDIVKTFFTNLEKV